MVSGSVAFDLWPSWKLIWRISGHIAPQVEHPALGGHPDPRVEWLSVTDFKARPNYRLLPWWRQYFLLCRWRKSWIVCQREDFFFWICQIYVHVLGKGIVLEENWDLSLHVSHFHDIFRSGCLSHPICKDNTDSIKYQWTSMVQAVPAERERERERGSFISS